MPPKTSRQSTSPRKRSKRSKRPSRAQRRTKRSHSYRGAALQWFGKTARNAIQHARDSPELQKAVKHAGEVGRRVAAQGRELGKRAMTQYTELEARVQNEKDTNGNRNIERALELLDALRLKVTEGVHRQDLERDLEDAIGLLEEA